ncbi:MAG: SpoIIIAH-like family protein [Oscillospiraceae bacterium]|nr:SpoIIIAH-like family protein [Oscillospiraceae bacterium]
MKKKNLVATVIILFVCVAVYLNMDTLKTQDDAERIEGNLGQSSTVSVDGDVPENEDNIQKKADGDTAEYFSRAREEKQKARDTALTTLKEALAEENLSEASRSSAAESIETISTGAVAETRIETLVKAKGYTDCVALINDAGVNVIVTAPDEGLTAADTTKIKDIAVSETDFLPSQIKIIEIK